MAFVKETLGIVLVAGILAAGVNAYLLARHPDTPAPAPKAGTGAPPVAEPPTREVTEARERLRNELAAARNTPPAAAAPQVAPSPPVPAPAPAPAPTEEPSPEVLARAVDRATGGQHQTVARPGAQASIERPEPVPDPRWTSTPHPELIAKADASFDNGDVAGARLWLEEALTKGDAEAALRLAETYDPSYLAEWKVVGMSSDVRKARALYERAWNGGVEAASQRLALLSKAPQ